MSIKKSTSYTSLHDHSMNDPHRRPLSLEERGILETNNNRADDWNAIQVVDGFNPHLVHSCVFHGMVTIGVLRNELLELDNFTLPIGLYESTFIHCRIGNNAAIHRLSYAGHYVFGNEVIVHAVGELYSEPFARFGNGCSTGEDKSHHYLEIINENGGRSVIPFKGMLASDAYLWAKYRNDHSFMKRLGAITRSTCASFMNNGGTIGNQAVIRNVRSIHNVSIGSHAQIIGAERLHNVTIESDQQEPTKIGAGVQLNESIIGFGNDIDSGAQLQHVVTGTNVHVDQSARIQHTYIGDNSAISCCEIGHSLIFPSHGQHHNNSFLIAAMIGGQSNIAAGATIGSNHNSRLNDGELWAGRGFWPGLSTNFKYNSRFASYVLCAKGDYPSELRVPLPFSLLTNDTIADQLNIVPAFWFTHNMYAFMRSNHKFASRDKRIHRFQIIEHDALAPDTVEEMFAAIDLLELWTGRALLRSENGDISDDEHCRKKGKALLAEKPRLTNRLEVIGESIERGRRKTIVKNVARAWNSYRTIIHFYAAKTIALYWKDHFGTKESISLELQPTIRCLNRWVNLGGQIVCEDELFSMINTIKIDNSIRTWDDIHKLYEKYATKYLELKYRHALGCIARLSGSDQSQLSKQQIQEALENARPICDSISQSTFSSREKDFNDGYRKMVYDSSEEMDTVLGTIEGDLVIKRVKKEMESLKEIIGLFI